MRREQIMTARIWYAPSIQAFAEDGKGIAEHPNEDETLDSWLASMSVPQFDWVMNFLMDQVYAVPSALDRPVA
jgi:hypothetical protein